MAATLFLSFPAIPLDALTVTSSQVLSGDNSIRTQATGPRSTYVELASNQLSWQLVYDLGVGNSSPVDHIIFSRGDLVATDLATLARSDDDISYTDEWSQATLFGASTLGTQGEDYAAQITPTTAHRYWRLSFTQALAANCRHSKVNFGTLFDFERDPESVDLSLREITQTFEAADGTEYQTRERTILRRYSAVWQGISDAKADEFEALAGGIRTRHCWLYAPSNTNWLQGFTLAHCEIEPESVRRERVFADWNLCAATFLEMRG